MGDMPTLEDLRRVQARLNLFGPLQENALMRELERSVQTGALTGRSVGLKANIAVQGCNWTAGLGHRAAIVAEQDAGVTRRLRDNGARVFPGLNMDAAALGGATDNADFGRTRNPHAPEHSAGGSSGGSAAAVAAGVVDMAIGTDTLGSVRIPASYCGVFGLKPTFGLVSRSGIVPLSPSLDTVGRITAQAADLWPLLTAIAGSDPDDPASRPAPHDRDIDAPETTAQDIRIGVPRQIASVECEADVLSAMTLAKTALTAAGARISDIDMPRWDPGRLRQNAFLLTEAEGAVSYATELEAGDTLPPAVEKLFGYGARMGTTKLVTALQDIAAVEAQLDNAFASVDVLLMPTTPQRAFHASEQPPVNQADFTALANAAGVPAVAIPVWTPGSALPASIQLVGPAWSERRLIGLAMVLQHAL